MSDPHQLRILFMGTPEFAAASLQKLLDEKANVVAVITAPDKPSGRGLEMNKSSVKILAEAHQLLILQPEKLKNPTFLLQLQSLQIDLGIVVAFRMLPELVWQMPKLGTFNLHGSLLPQYRGAAPINWAIINGEKETGITTFFLKHEIDTGDLLLQEKVEIGSADNVGIIYEKLMNKGAALVWKTIEGIASDTLVPFPQPEMKTRNAPKIFKETCLLDFNTSAFQIHNMVRGLSPVPGAFTKYKGKVFKIFEGKETKLDCSTFEPGTFRQIQPGVLAVATKDFWFEMEIVQPEGKRKMNVREFLAGHQIEKI